MADAAKVMLEEIYMLGDRQQSHSGYRSKATRRGIGARVGTRTRLWDMGKPISSREWCPGRGAFLVSHRLAIYDGNVVKKGTSARSRIMFLLMSCSIFSQIKWSICNREHLPRRLGVPPSNGREMELDEEK